VPAWWFPTNAAADNYGDRAKPNRRECACLRASVAGDVKDQRRPGLHKLAGGALGKVAAHAFYT